MGILRDAVLIDMLSHGLLRLMGWFTTTTLKMPIKRGAEPKYKRSIHKSERGKDEKKETH